MPFGCLDRLVTNNELCYRKCLAHGCVQHHFVAQFAGVDILREHTIARLNSLGSNKSSLRPYGSPRNEATPLADDPRWRWQWRRWNMDLLFFFHDDDDRFGTGRYRREAAVILPPVPPIARCVSKLQVGHFAQAFADAFIDLFDGVVAAPIESFHPIRSCHAESVDLIQEPSIIGRQLCSICLTCRAASAKLSPKQIQRWSLWP